MALYHLGKRRERKKKEREKEEREREKKTFILLRHFYSIVGGGFVINTLGNRIPKMNKYLFIY